MSPRQPVGHSVQHRRIAAVALKNCVVSHFVEGTDDLVRSRRTPREACNCELSYDDFERRNRLGKLSDVTFDFRPLGRDALHLFSSLTVALVRQDPASGRVHGGFV
jgi:hypothetical protein